MPDNKLRNMSWVEATRAMAANAADAVFALRWWQWLLSALVIVFAIGFISSIAEFIVAVQNRYSVYPVGYDSNMTSKSIGLEGVLSLGAAFLVGYLWKIVPTQWYVVVLALSLSGLICMIDTQAQWVVVPFFLIFAITIGLSFWAKIPFLVPLLGFCIMLLLRPSMLPDRWCKYELTMYPCADQINYNLNSKQ